VEHPFVYSYSSSGGAVYICLEPHADRGGLHSALFVDFLEAIVDALADQDKAEILHLLKPSPALFDELKRLNKKRKRWRDDDEDYNNNNNNNNNNNHFILPK